MSIIVAYHTKTGHSRKLARAVAADLGTEALDIRRWKPGLQADTLLLFGGIYGGKSDGPMLVFARALRPGMSTVRCCSPAAPPEKAGRATCERRWPTQELR